MNFKSIIQFTQYFNTDDKCREFLEEQRWGDTPACPHCGSTNVVKFKTDNKTYKCREKVCRKKFTVTVGTMYENTKIPLTKWFLATYILSVHSKGISSLQLAEWLNVTQKTAWFLTHRIREMLADNAPELLNEVVEIDETYVGGKISNKHVSKRKQYKANDNKTMVIGAVQREGKVKTKVIPNADVENIQNAVVEFVEPNSTMYTDESRAYNKVKDNYKHDTVRHRSKEYVRGDVHTNTIEGFWSVLKRQIHGIHHFVSPKHLQRYCNESSYRYNTRGLEQDERFADVVSRCNGRLTYKSLING
ncbi:IS1595 family transposase [Roseivirga sp. UBA838]|uniref:IS1595 family transposase n=1 Tax=Roseivirga sp. UBA838 TaxID=1947393 RepID=UPI00257D7D76|nr:IS1595 family transposase [Roseivirga sp. UBA838]|tara:strand:- start:3028 stop:3939 length:912 start_codon:yes stop_codon:yes gene_type:complete